MYVLAIDQGTTSSRVVLVDTDGQIAGPIYQREHRQVFPQSGWVEHDSLEIWNNVRDLLIEAANAADGPIVAIGVTNQRETTVVWDAITGLPVYNAIVWQDTRTQDMLEAMLEEEENVRRITGLTLNTYFSASKIRWILQHRSDLSSTHLLFGTIDTWLVWQLTNREVHVTDVTNASRTLLMDIEGLNWSQHMLDLFEIPRCMLPEIRSSSEVVGYIRMPSCPQLDSVPIASLLGDQQAAMFGQVCFEVGSVKTTYGTGNFTLMNTGSQIVRSQHGMLTTVAYKRPKEKAVYALEGSVAVTGSLIKWLCNSLGFAEKVEDVETLARSVEDNGGCYLVPAFAGLFAPYWRSDARGSILGLSFYHTKAHIARAALESTGYQTHDVCEAMQRDQSQSKSEGERTPRTSGTARTRDDTDTLSSGDSRPCTCRTSSLRSLPLTGDIEPLEGVHEMKVDGGMTANALLMQFQADMLGCEVIVSATRETTALGAALSAGLAVGVWGNLEELTGLWRCGRRYLPSMDGDQRESLLKEWRKAVSKASGWRSPRLNDDFCGCHF